MIRIKNKLLALALVFLGISVIFCFVQCCGHNRSQTLKFVNPPSDSADWSSQFVLWPNLPVRVRVTGDAWQIIAADANRSVQAWNRVIGCRVLTMSFDVDAEVVVAHTPKPESFGEGNLAGTAQYVPRRNKKWGRYWGSDIHIHHLYYQDQNKRDNVMAHELGHALGLADLEDPPENLMYGSVSFGMYLDEKVLETLNRIYCTE